MRSERGFSLVEELAAFAILALALVAIFRSYGMAARSVSEAAQERAALDLARNLIATGADALKPGTENGEEGQLRWRRHIASWRRESTQTAVLYRITVTVEWEERQIALATLAVHSDVAP